MPTIDFTSHLTHSYKVIKVYDGDTITIETAIGTTVSLRLVGVDTPEINAETQAEKDLAIAARDYLREMILDKDITITFEASESTLDGIGRGTYCRPLSYIFIRDEEADKNIFVNLQIVWDGHGKKYFKYDFAYQDFFRLDQPEAQKRIDALELMPEQTEALSQIDALELMLNQAEAPKHRKTMVTTWANLKRVD